MEVQVSWLGIILATASSMVVGTIWYARPVFGNLWMKLTGREGKEQDGASAGKAIAVTVVVSFITAYVLAHVAFLSHEFFQNSFLQDAVTTAFWLWAGLTAARFITHDAFEARPVMLTVLNVAHELVTLLVMGVIIGLFKP